MRPAFKRTHHTATSWGECTQGDTRWEQPKLPPRPPRRPTCPPTEGARSTCIWCGRAVHPSRRHCPTSNGTCHGCGKRRHWQQLCKGSSANVVSDVEQNFPSESQPTYFITHDVFQVSSSPKGTFFDLDVSPPSCHTIISQTPQIPG